MLPPSIGAAALRLLAARSTAAGCQSASMAGALQKFVFHGANLIWLDLETYRLEVGAGMRPRKSN